MSPQFKPSDASDVASTLESKGFVREVVRGHSTVSVTLRGSRKECVGGVFDRHGWVVESFDTERNTVTFVPADNPRGLQ